MIADPICGLREAEVLPHSKSCRMKSNNYRMRERDGRQLEEASGCRAFSSNPFLGRNSVESGFQSNF